MNFRTKTLSLLMRSYSMRRIGGVALSPSVPFASFVAASRCNVRSEDGSLSNKIMLHLFAIYLNDLLMEYRKPVVHDANWQVNTSMLMEFIQMGSTFEDDYPTMTDYPSLSKYPSTQINRHIKTNVHKDNISRKYTYEINIFQ